MNETFRVENVKTFLTLFPFRSNEPEEWHYIDLTEEKWDTLVKELSSEEFEACVTDTLKLSLIHISKTQASSTWPF